MYYNYGIGTLSNDLKNFLKNSSNFVVPKVSDGVPDNVRINTYVTRGLRIEYSGDTPSFDVTPFEVESNFKTKDETNAVYLIRTPLPEQDSRVFGTVGYIDTEKRSALIITFTTKEHPTTGETPSESEG
jgi:hypothetical protein